MAPLFTYSQNPHFHDALHRMTTPIWVCVMMAHKFEKRQFMQLFMIMLYSIIKWYIQLLCKDYPATLLNWFPGHIPASSFPTVRHCIYGIIAEQISHFVVFKLYFSPMVSYVKELLTETTALGAKRMQKSSFSAGTSPRASLIIWWVNDA